MTTVKISGSKEQKHFTLAHTLLLIEAQILIHSNCKYNQFFLQINYYFNQFLHCEKNNNDIIAASLLVQDKKKIMSVLPFPGK